MSVPCLPTGVTEATQSIEEFTGKALHFRPAFMDWQHRLREGERLPRGKYFKGKTPGKPLAGLDEYWLANADFVRRNNG